MMQQQVKIIKIIVKIEIKNKDKNIDRKPSKDGHKLYTPNNYNNRVVGPPKGKVLEGQPPRYSDQQQNFF